MSWLAPGLLFVALFAIGFLPMQRLKSRRAAVIGGLLGVVIVATAMALLRAYPSDLNNIPQTVFVFWLVLVGAAMVPGALVRFAILSFPGLGPRDRRLITAGLAVVICALLLLALRALGAALD